MVSGADGAPPLTDLARLRLVLLYALRYQKEVRVHSQTHTNTLGL
jgi:hypothetical protein